jgi:hypothetical protein
LWRRTEAISWTDRVRNNDVLHKVKEEWNILHTIKKRKTNSICHIWRRNSLLKYVIKGKIEERIPVAERRGRRWKQLLDYFNETRGQWKLKENCCTLGRTHSGRGCEHTARHTAE